VFFGSEAEEASGVTGGGEAVSVDPSEEESGRGERSDAGDRAQACE